MRRSHRRFHRPVPRLPLRNHDRLPSRHVVHRLVRPKIAQPLHPEGIHPHRRPQTEVRHRRVPGVVPLPPAADLLNVRPITDEDADARPYGVPVIAGTDEADAEPVTRLRALVEEDGRDARQPEVPVGDAAEKKVLPPVPVQIPVGQAAGEAVVEDARRGGHVRKGAVAPVQEDAVGRAVAGGEEGGGTDAAVGHDEVRPAVVVQVREAGAPTDGEIGPGGADPFVHHAGRPGDFGESAVPGVLQEDVGPDVRLIVVQVPVPVVVPYAEAHAVDALVEARRGAAVREGVLGEVVAVEGVGGGPGAEVVGDEDVHVVVLVVVAEGGGQAAPRIGQAEAGGHVRKREVALIEVEAVGPAPVGEAAQQPVIVVEVTGFGDPIDDVDVQ